MSQLPMALTVTCLALGSLPAFAVDLNPVPRRIAKEPSYQSAAPRYCRLAFGPDAAHHVWLVLDGDTLYVDRNGNGDLTEGGESAKAPACKASDPPPFERERSIDAGDLTGGGLTHTQGHRPWRERPR